MRVVAFARFENGVTDGAMLPLDDAVCLQVVCQDADVPNAIPVRKPVKSSHISCAVVSNNLLYRSPLAKDLFKDKCSNHLASLHL